MEKKTLTISLKSFQHHTSFIVNEMVFIYVCWPVGSGEIFGRIAALPFSPINEGILFLDKTEKVVGEERTARDLCIFHRSLNQMVNFSLVRRFWLIKI
jgi:hypothetical protein